MSFRKRFFLRGGYLFLKVVPKSKKFFLVKFPIKKYQPNKPTFPSILLFIGKRILMENITTTNNQKQYKRQDRSVSPETAQKISNSLKTYNATHPRPDIWCKRISDGLKADTGGYWSKVPPKKDVGQDGTTMDDLVF